MDVSLLALTFAIGAVTGLRSMTAPAIVCWAAHRGWIDLEQSRLEFLRSNAAVGIATLLALGELAADKLPFMPSRRKPGPLLVRLAFGAFSGAALCIGWYDPWRAGAAMGAVGALAGTFGGYEFRTRLVKKLDVPDYVIALIEDFIAVVGGIFIAHSMVI